MTQAPKYPCNTCKMFACPVKMKYPTTTGCDYGKNIMEQIKKSKKAKSRAKVLDEAIAILHKQLAANWTPHRAGLDKAVLLLQSLRSSQPEPGAGGRD